MQPYERLSQVYDSGWSDFSRRYAALIAALLKERGGGRGRVLDLACGTGALTVELAQRGHTVHGIDSSPQMIARARAKSENLSRVSFDVQDMVGFKVAGKFDLVTCTFDSVNYLLGLNEVATMFRRVSAVLRPGGLFIFDTNTRKLYISHLDETQKHVLEGQHFIQHCTYEPVRNEAITTFSFEDGFYEIHRQRPYDLEDLEPALVNTGLTILHLFSWFDRTPYSGKTEKLFCVAEKRVK
jgi:SAM-dependent methyltransferase